MKRFFWIFVVVAITTSFYCLETVSARPLGLSSFPLADEHAIVYDENGSGGPDLSGDTWVFDTDDNHRADLIIRFRQTPTLTAFVYDDTDSDGQVDYQVDAAALQISEPHWRAQVISRDGQWVLPSGLPDWNLDLQFDSFFVFIPGVPVIPRSSSCADAPGTTVGIQLSDKPAEGKITNNQPNLQVRYWDLNGDGVPDQEWRNWQTSSPSDILLVNEDPGLLYKPAHRFPLLDTVLWMDWARARVQAVRPLIPNGTQAGYMLRFDHAVAAGSTSAATEDPSAYYNLRGSDACLPSLVIHAISNDHDLTRSSLTAYDQITYSWAQSGGNLQYRLFLLGQIFTNQIIPYPAFSVPHIPYADLPGFVLGNRWDAASFAEMENPARATSVTELPENPYFLTSLSRFFSGWQNIKLPDDDLPVFLSMRQEYNFRDYDRSPGLYLSLIDNRLHLLGAQRGLIIFSADNTNALPGFDFSLEDLTSGKPTIRSATNYSDSDGDGYIDTWIYQENGQPVRAMVVRPGVALMAQSNSIVVKRLPSDFKPYAWQAPPPATPAEWSTYQQLLTPVQAKRRGLNDLGGIFSDLPGDEFTIPNSSLQSVSVNGQSLAAQIATSGFSVSQGAPLITALGNTIQAGEYVLRDNHGTLALELPLHANLLISPLSLDSSGPAPTNQLGILSFSVQNPGNLDVNAQLNVWDENSAAKSLLQQRKIAIPAAGQLDVSLPWSPVSSGLHHLVAEVNYTLQPGGAAQQTRQSLDKDISIPDTTGDTFFLSAGYLPDYIFLLIVLISVLMGAGWVTLHSLEKTDEPPV